MKKETLKKIFYFLENEENKKIPTDWKSANDKIIKQKLINGEPLTDYDLTIENYLDLQDTEITSLPIGFTVKNNLDLGFSKITSLPKGLYVGGKLSLISCKNLKFLPKGLYVGDSLSLMYTNIDSLPEGLYVGEELYINNTPLAKKYTDQEIRDNVTSTGGEIIGRIYR
jgi:hypothetical protein